MGLYNFLVNNGQRIAFGLGVLVVAVFLISVLNGQSAFNALSEEEQSTTTIFNPGISGALVLTVICAVAIILFGLIQTVLNIKTSWKSLVGLGLVALVFIIAYTSANGDPAAEIQPIADSIERTGGISTNGLKIIGGGITTALVLLGGAAAAFAISEIINFFK